MPPRINKHKVITKSHSEPFLVVATPLNKFSFLKFLSKIIKVLKKGSDNNSTHSLCFVYFQDHGSLRGGHAP